MKQVSLVEKNNVGTPLTTLSREGELYWLREREVLSAFAMLNLQQNAPLCNGNDAGLTEEAKETVLVNPKPQDARTPSFCLSATSEKCVHRKRCWLYTTWATNTYGN